MNPQQPEKPVRLEFDAEQWQRDVRTFADTTNQALHAIVAQLSNSCSTDMHPTITNPGRKTEPSQTAESARSAQHESEQQQEPNLPTATTEVGSDDRLSKLKSKLAQRIAKSR